MTGKVFISCGQRPPHETSVADAIGKLLHEEFGLTPYVACRQQSLAAIMEITNELRACDYYLFIDFKRRKEKPDDLPCSLFTHQELALAHHLGFVDQVIALQQEGAPLEGFLKYVQGNPASFKTVPELLAQVRALVRERGWKPGYSRNLVVGSLTRSELFSYTDHTGPSYFNVAWKAKIENRRPDTAAARLVCILDLINGEPCADRSYLKWADQASYEPTVLPLDFGWLVLFVVRPDRPGLFLQSSRDHVPRMPIVEANGDYDLTFKIFAPGFPLLQFFVNLSLRWEPTAPCDWRKWQTRSKAEIKV